MNRYDDPSEPPLDPELAALQRALTGFTPKAPRIDRDRLMYRAGRAAALRSESLESSPEPTDRARGARRSRSWSPALAAVASAAALLFAALWGVERSRREPPHWAAAETGGASPAVVAAPHSDGAASGGAVRRADESPTPHDQEEREPAESERRGGDWDSPARTDIATFGDLLARRDAALLADDRAPVRPIRAPSDSESFERTPVSYGQALRTAVDRPLSFGLGWQP